MTTYQEYLNSKYPRQEIKSIEIDSEKLSGSLIISNYPQLKKLTIRNQNSSTLQINNCPNLKELIVQYSPLTTLDLTNLPNLEKLDLSYNFFPSLDLTNQQKLKYLNINNNNLTTLTTNSKDLEELIAWNNNLTELNIQNCLNLKILYCSNNNLTNLDLSNNLGLEELDISNNNFAEQDLSFLKDLVNLKRLGLGNSNQERINQEIYNKFKGSLEFLRGMNELGWLDIDDTDISNGLEYLGESVESFSCSADKRKGAKVKAIYDLVGNSPQKFQDYKQWRKLNFSGEKIKEWINAGAKLDDYKFIAWLRDIKKEIPEWITNYKEDYQMLSEKFKRYGLCPECNQPNTGEQWCQACNEPRIKKNFSNWTSGKTEIDEFIQKYQLQATDANKFIEWIPYEQFGDIAKLKALQTINSELQSLHLEYENLNRSKFKQIANQSKIKQTKQKITNYSSEVGKLNKEIEERINVEYLAEGGFGKVYKAKWTEGNIHHWGIKSKQWHREKDKDYYYEEKDKKEWDFERNKDKYKKYKSKDYRVVVLKSLADSQNNTDFLQEVEKHKIIDDWFNNIVPCYGLSQDPQTGNYLMVMQYMPEGNLRKYLSNKNKELSLKDKISHLTKIAQGLKDIHQKNLVHRDFHSGNILKGIEKTSCLITDLGLCKPANESSKEDKIFGVLPYVAPEVLNSRPYAQASDIYSFGIIAYEMLSGLPPYYDRNHDQYLGITICQGLRPRFQIKIPRLLENLINCCWDADPQKRPTASELEKTLRDWKKNIKFAQQLQEAEEYNKTLPDNIKFPKYKIHQEAIYHSKLLPTKEITQLLISNQLQTKTTELNNYLMKTQQLAKEIINLENLAKTEQKKRNDFKRALKTVLEKSDEIEKIIATSQLVISDEMKEMLEKIKGLKNKSQNKETKIQELEESKAQKEKELEELKKSIITNNHLEEDDLEDILEAQASNDFKRLERTKKKLARIISEKEINQLCQKQAEITQLAIQLEENTKQGDKQLTQIINNIGSININQGHAIISSSFGDSANIVSNYAVEETEQTAQILHQPYGTPGSSKPK